MRDIDAQLVHDMRNTAMVLREASAQLQEGVTTLTPEAIDHLCSMMSRRSDMLVRLLDDLGTSNLADRGTLALSKQAVSLAEICNDVLGGHCSGPGGTLTLEVPDDSLVVGDALRITQIVDNLVSNALRYGGPDISVAAAREDSVMRLSVTDNGRGVSEDLVDSLFEGYSRGNSSHRFGGSGLGLMIVRQFAEAMGGTVGLDQNCGTRFTVTLPGVPSTSHALAPDQAQEGHCVAFWTEDDVQRNSLVSSIASYAAHGLTGGEAVVIAATHDRLEGVASELSALGLDAEVFAASGQYIALDAHALHLELAHQGHIDQARFERHIGDRVRGVSAEWSSLRVYGEIVDLFWRRGDSHLALELESCWNSLREQVPFPLLCGYELAPGYTDGTIRACHDAVVA